MQWTSFHTSENRKTSRMSTEQRGIAIGFMNAGVPHAKLRHIYCNFLMEFISNVRFKFDKNLSIVYFSSSKKRRPHVSDASVVVIICDRTVSSVISRYTSVQ